MPSIAEVAKKWNMLVIEDACHAIGGSVSLMLRSKIGACAFSDAATFSFHPVKNLTTCEGGAISLLTQRVVVSDEISETMVSFVRFCSVKPNVPSILDT